MDRGDVERVFAAADAQEARGLFEGLRAEARDRRQLHARAEPAVLVAVLDDLLRGPLVDPGDVAEQRPRGRIQVDADAVDAGFHRRFEALLQPALVHVVLILADADRLRDPL